MVDPGGPKGTPARDFGVPAIAVLMLLVMLGGAIGVHYLRVDSRPTHVVLVVIDTVRADRLGCYGYDRDTSPRLDALADEGLRFAMARAPAPWTLPSHASLFTGLTPAEHGCTWENPRLSANLTTLAETLAVEHGYETFGVTSNVNASSAYALDQGFETFLETYRYREEHRGLDDSGILNARVADWLENRDSGRPFFLFVNYLDAHLPYDPRPPYDSLFGEVSGEARALAARAPLLRHLLRDEVRISPELWGELGTLYDGEVRQVDARVGELLDQLEEHGLAEDTLVVVTSDHGELLGEEGLADHQLCMREELLHVPLLVRWPGWVEPGVIDEPVSLTDVFGWLIDGVEGRHPRWTPPPEDARPSIVADYARPVELLHFLRREELDATPHDRRQVALYAVEEGRGAKYVIDSNGVERVFLLGKGERADVTESRPDLLERFAGQLRRDPLRMDFLRAPPGPGGAPLRGSTSWEQLIALGYLQDDAADVDAVAAILVSVIECRGRGQYDQCLRLLDYALELHPGEVDLLFARAETLEAEQRPEAREAWRRFVEVAGQRGDADGPRVERARRRLGEE